MNNNYQLFTEVQPFYTALLDSIENAQQSISMLYLIFDQGLWADRISNSLACKHAAGVKVRVMADFLGTLTDHPLNLFNNFKLIKYMHREGIEFKLFNPAGSRMSFLDRLHIKMCAVDDETMFLGGSNIGDYYTTWQDTNIRIQGALEGIGHRVYDLVAANSTTKNQQSPNLKYQFDLADAKCGDAKLFLTVPGARRDICRNLVDLILAATGTIYLRYWYFLPDTELLNAMLSQLEKGVKIKILLSHHTRIPPVDLANQRPLKILSRAGACVYRYTERYMHSKIAWTDSGDVIIGSANLEPRALRNNFEICLRLCDRQLAEQLSDHFLRDTEKCKCL